MKKQLLTIALLAGALTASAGVNLVVSGQQQQSFAVGDIGKITFTESTMMAKIPARSARSACRTSRSCFSATKREM